MQLSEIPTPAVLVDAAKLRRNLTRMQAAASARGIRLRPHAKTHKSPEIARMQIEGGAAGICCAKLGEAEVFADAGIGDIRLPYPLNPVNADRVFALAERVALSFIVDDPAVARVWSDLAGRRGRTLDVLIKVDVGFHRCGIDPHAGSAASIVRDVASLPGLRFRGLLSHAGHGYAAASDKDAEAIAKDEAALLCDLAAASGVRCEEISVGATPTVRHSLRQRGVTEARPGNYAYFDRTQVSLGAAAWSDCALTVLARVVSRPARDRLILDSGSKTLSNDLAPGFAPTPGYGVVLRDIAGAEPDASLLIERLSEEHATVRVADGETPLVTGALARIIPNHSCVVSNLVDHVWLVEDDRVVSRLPVAARGRIT
ncbi:MAG TPA: alanine racemase [Vicinamibacterales bacterium]|nr:alanine racemase [Vicinamibacterales bacterium]